MSTRGNLDPHLQIDPFPGREADYPPFGYTGHMPTSYDYRYGTTPDGSSGLDSSLYFSSIFYLDTCGL
ncbi:hypothetical protein Tco_1309440 [Tanacetum coccineum]